jgi:predicted nucleic acid-binding protein
VVDRIVLDSSVILSFLRRDPGRGEVVRSALYLASQTPIQTRFLASTVAVAEVAYVEGLATSLSDGFEVIDGFWAASPIQLVEAHAAIAFHARDLMRKRLLQHHQPQFPNVRKRAADVLHLSTAIWLEADEFWTYDVSDFARYPQSIVNVCEPHVSQMMLEGLL